MCARRLLVNWSVRRVQVFAAVAPESGELISLILPTANTAMTSLFLTHVSETLADFLIVMQVDQAGWHHSRTLQVPSHIRLIAQPAHSRRQSIPSSNGSEELREKDLHNLAFHSLDALEERLCEGLRAIMQDKERIGSWMGFPHLKIAA